MTEEEQEPTEEEKMWESLKEEKHGQGDEVFDCFLQGQERSKAANEALGNALRVFARKMEDNGNFFIQNLLGPIYDVQREKLHQLEADCKKLLIENHEKRTKYYKELDAAEKKISKNIRAMKALTLGIPESDDSNGDSSSPDKVTK